MAEVRRDDQVARIADDVEAAEVAQVDVLRVGVDVRDEVDALAGELGELVILEVMVSWSTGERSSNS